MPPGDIRTSTKNGKRGETMNERKTDMASPDPTTPPSLWSDIVDTIRGRSRDHTQGHLGRSILVLAVPMVLEMCMQSVFAVADTWYVGQLGSSSALAAVGLTEALMSIIFAIGIGLSMGTGAMVARRIGEGDRDGAAKTAVQAIWLGVLISVVLGAGAAFMVPQLFGLMEAPGDVLEVGRGYATHIFAGTGTILLLFLINAIFRGTGDAMTAMKALWLANILNIVLDPIFIFGWGPVPAMGVTGAAVATNISRGIGVLYQFGCLARGAGGLNLTRAHIGLRFDVMTRLLRVSGVGMFQMLVGTASWVGLVRVMNNLGNVAALAGYTIAVRVIIFALLPAWGMGNAAATLVGQNLGAKKPDRAERAAWTTARYDMLFLAFIGLLTWWLAPPVMAFFSDDPNVVDWGARCLRIVAICYPAIGIELVLMMSFNGAGDTWTPTYIAMVCHWALKISLALVLAKSFGFGPDGVFVAITTAEIVAAVAYVWLFRRGRWKATVV